MIKSMSADLTPGDPDDELLVAYLDGELDRGARMTLENRLLDEPSLRTRLSQLQSGWDMLDVLSVDGAGVSLVESTMELAIAQVQSEGRIETKPAIDHTLADNPDQSSTHPEAKLSRATTRPARRGWNTKVWKFTNTRPVVVLCLLAIPVGFLTAMFQSNRQQRRELMDLALVQNLDAYNLGGDLDLMRTLANDPQWLQLSSRMSELSTTSTEGVLLDSVAISKRTEAIKSMSTQQRERLSVNWESFRRMSDRAKHDLRKRASVVAADPDADELLGTMKTYAIWRSRLSSELVDRIEGADPKVRQQAIRQAIDQSRSALAKDAGLRLDDETVDVVYLALQEFARKRFSKNGGRIRWPAGMRGSADAFSQPTARWFAIRQLFSEGGGRAFSPRRGGDPRPSGQATREDHDGPNTPRAGLRRRGGLSASEVSTIESLLPDDSSETLTILTGGDPTLISVTLQIWVEEVIRRKAPFRSTENLLLSRYEDLDQQQRERIDLLPPNQMLEILSSSRPAPP